MIDVVVWKQKNYFDHSVVVDSGCGTGSLASEIALQNPNSVVIGVDITKGVEKAQEFLDELTAYV